ncbi:MAG TPA: hypothetical protein VHY36_10465 [Steroidobacteraceae bacterium]|jgi:ElaB/YqjD/DUF883 family membrane-anchored ribosome-binding protein|nr:hypothetical protein [Steroidobacteraceae bacterium]
MAKRRTKHANAAVADTATGLQDLIDSAEELLESLRDQQGAAVELLRAKVSATIGNARERIGELDVPVLASDAVEGTVAFLRSDPWRSVALGALAALAISLLFSHGSED